MLDEPDLVVLARVIDRGSFARAAADLDVPPSTLSRRVTALEKRLGVRVLERTTRHLRATEVGELLATRGRRVREELEDADRVVADHRATPRGLLRLAVPSPVGDLLGPVVVDLLARHPELRLELGVSDNPLELLERGFDAALHAGAIPGRGDHGVVRIGHISPVLAASTRYLERAPAIRHPRDLTDPAHTIITGARRATWDLVHVTSGKKLTLTPAPPRVLVAAKVLAADLVAHGVGVGFIPRALALAHADIRVLEPGGYRPAGGTLVVVTPSARTQAPKVRALVDAVKAYAARRPDLIA